MAMIRMQFFVSRACVRGEDWRAEGGKGGEARVYRV